MSTQLVVAGVPVYIEGSGEYTIVMIHGWPDTHRIWSKQVEFFSKNYRCVMFTLPDFGDTSPKKGYSLDEVIETIHQVIQSVSPDKKVILMIHDWGCIYGYQFAMLYPERVKKLIAIDIGDSNSRELAKSLSVAAKGMIFSYQLTLATAWVIGGFVGDKITRGVAKGLQCKAESQHIHSRMNYPYAIRWLRTLGTFDGLKQVNPECPFFYAYGRKKPFMFQSPVWQEKMAALPNNIVREFNSGHWVMVDKADEFNAAVSEWLTATR
jgi:pimeloyl-ACP methyl ester carboxylesterase